MIDDIFWILDFLRSNLSVDILKSAYSILNLFFCLNCVLCLFHVKLQINKDNEKKIFEYFRREDIEK